MLPLLREIGVKQTLVFLYRGMEKVCEFRAKSTKKDLMPSRRQVLVLII
jgi:hypothetical protein